MYILLKNQRDKKKEDENIEIEEIIKTFQLDKMAKSSSIFDYDKLNGDTIEVRLARKNEEILCLNNVLNKLSIIF